MRRRITLFSRPQREGYESAVERLKNCCADIDEFLRSCDAARKHELRLAIGRYVPGGVYMPGDGDEQKAFVVFGVRHHPDLLTRERAFYVSCAPLADISTGELEGAWPRLPLVETDGFLSPIVRDGYRGDRYVRIGEFRE